MDDPDNYIKLHVAWNDSFFQESFSWGQGIALASEKNGTYIDWENRPKTSLRITDEGMFLKISKKGTAYHGFYSNDGKAWVELGSLDMPPMRAAKVGIFGMTGVDSNCKNFAPEIPVEFDFFHVICEDDDC